MEAVKRKICIALETEPGKKFKNGQESCQNCAKLQKLLEEREEDIRQLQARANKEAALKELESKVDKLAEAVSKQEAPKPSPVANFSLDALHNKVDKLVRLLSDTVEAQSKMSKTLENLSKNSAAAAKPAKTAKPPPTSMAAALKIIQNESAAKKADENEGSAETAAAVKPENLDELIERQKTEAGVVEMRWAQNLLLAGDDLWQSFSTVDDVNVVVEKMKKQVNLKVNCRPSETLSRLYDANRDKLLFAFPPKIYRIAISIGAQDLLADGTLLTLRQASLEEVKQKNSVPLQEKAGQLKGMVAKLLALNKHVVLVVPTTGTQRVEVFRHWEEIVLETFQDVTTPAFKILNLPELIRSTLPDFKNQEDHLTTWFADLASATKLTSYGTRRLFDALKRTVLSRSKNYLEGRFFTNDFPPCPRCTRQHARSPSTCRSVDRMCRRCGVVGHFVEVHAVTDPKFRRQIVAELGFDVFATQGCEPDPNPPPASASGPGSANDHPSPPQPAALASLNDWYAVA